MVERPISLAAAAAFEPQLLKGIPHVALKQITPNTHWQKLNYVQNGKRLSLDSVVDTAKRQYPVPELVCLVCHGLRPEEATLLEPAKISLIPTAPKTREDD
jgi:hypothetical protein